MRILVVDDNPINQKIVQFTFRKTFDVDTADDGEEAVQKVSHNIYDLIIMDLCMPIMDGAEATMRIRQLESNADRNTPILVYTTSDIEKDRIRCMKHGANEYLVKPVKASILQEKVNCFFK